MRFHKITAGLCAWVLAFSGVAGGFPLQNTSLTVHAAESGECGENLTWTLADGVLTISGTGRMTDFTYQDSQSIPSWYYNRDAIRQVVIEDGVTSIGDKAFYGCAYLTGISIPDSVTSIGYAAMFECTALTSVTIPAGVTYISEGAVSGCTSLSELVVSDDNAYYTSQDNVIFDKSRTLLVCCAAGKQGTYTIPDTVTGICDYGFYFCSSLTNVTIPNSVTSIGFGAFFGCTGLTGITIPESVTDIGGAAFSGCIGAAALNVAEANPNYTSQDGVLFDKSLQTLICCAGGKSGDYTIPDSVTAIEDYAFYYCYLLSYLTVPNSVVRIGSEAFTGCENLTIKSYTGSYAETYAADNTIHFVSLGLPPVQDPNPDMNNDGEITASDAQAVLVAFSELLADNPSGLTPQQEAMADVDRNGEITALDAQYILTYYLYNSVLDLPTSWDEVLHPSGTYTPVVPIDPNDITYFIASGKYDAEAGTLTLSWNERPDAESYDITLSANGEETLLDTVTEGLKYTYAVPETFESGEFTVSYTDAENETFRTPPVILNRTDDGFAVSYPDTDGDGIPDPAEFQFETDPELADTDGDGLSDFEELVKTSTDPTDYDSCQEGVADGEADPDGDGLTNTEEIALGTSPNKADSDGDGLLDGEEVRETLTDPLKEDTDEDGLNDAFEAHNNLNPLSAETDGVADFDRQIEQTVSPDSNAMITVNTEESPYSMSVKITTNGDAEKEMDIQESLNSASLKSDAQIGEVISLSISDACNPTAIRLEYAIKDDYIDNTLNYYTDFDNDLDGIKRLCVFKFYEEIDMMLPIETYYDTENNTLYADVDTLGEYCIMDLEIWYDLFNLEVDPSAEEDDETVPEDETVSPEALDNTQPRKQSVVTGKFTRSVMRSPFKLLATTPSNLPAVPTKKIQAPLDLVFVLQTAGPDQALQIYEDELTLMETVTDYVFKAYSDVRVYVVDYKFDQAEILKFSGYDYCSNVTALSNGIRALKYDKIGNEDYCETQLAFDKVKNGLKLRKNVNTFIYHLHNGSNLYNTTLDGITLSESDIGIFSQILPVTYVFHQAWYEEALSTAIQNNGGLNIRYDADTAKAILEHIAGKLDYSKIRTEYDALLSRNLTKITLNGRLSPTNNIDSDGDAVRDWDEVKNRSLTVNSDGTVKLPTVGDLIDQIDNLDNIIGYIPDSTARAQRFETVKKMSVLPCITNPVKADSDDDGYTDLADPYPNQTPEFLNKKYNFMHNEVYYLRAANGKRLNHSGTALSMQKKSKDEEQEFKFIWGGSSYKITTTDETLVLTLTAASAGGYTLMMQRDRGVIDQRWEVLPYDKNSRSGFVLRCRTIDQTTDTVGKPIYLSFSDSGVSTVSEVNESCILYVDSICDDWKRFGQLYMEVENWIPHKDSAYFYDLDRAFRNYRDNQSVTFDTSKDNDYIVSYPKNNGVKIRVYQNGEKYRNMMYADAPMNEVICEVMGTYNAMCMAKGTNNAADFLRLATEFEMSGRRTVILDEDVGDFFIYRINFWIDFFGGEPEDQIHLTDSFYKDGGWGSWPHLIENCLKCYQMKYKVYWKGSDIDTYFTQIFNFEAALADSSAKCAILSKNDGFLIHTFAVDRGSRIDSYNNDCSLKGCAGSEDTILETIKGWAYYYGYVLY